MNRIKARQRALPAQRAAALAREPELIAPGEVTFLAHALVVPSDDPDDRQRYSVEVERVAVCATPAPSWLRVQNPFQRHLGGPSGSWLIDKTELVQAAE